VVQRRDLFVGNPPRKAAQKIFFDFSTRWNYPAGPSRTAEISDRPEIS